MHLTEAFKKEIKWTTIKVKHYIDFTHCINYTLILVNATIKVLMTKNKHVNNQDDQPLRRDTHNKSGYDLWGDKPKSLWAMFWKQTTGEQLYKSHCRENFLWKKRKHTSMLRKSYALRKKQECIVS